MLSPPTVSELDGTGGHLTGRHWRLAWCVENDPCSPGPGSAELDGEWSREDTWLFSYASQTFRLSLATASIFLKAIASTVDTILGKLNNTQLVKVQMFCWR